MQVKWLPWLDADEEAASDMCVDLGVQSDTLNDMEFRITTLVRTKPCMCH